MRKQGQLSLAGRRGALGALAAAFVASAGCAHSEPETDAVAKPPAAASQTPAAAVETVTRGWSTERSYSYRLSLTTTIAIGDGPKNFDFDLRGNAVVIPARVAPDAAVLYVSIPDAVITSRIAGTEPEFDKAAAEVRATGIFFTLSRGKLGEIRIPEGQSPLASNSYRTLASALQFAHAAHGEDRYAAEEFDSTGRASVEYAASGDPSHWKKTKLRYLAVLGSGAPAAASDVPILPEVTSEGRVALAPTGRPLSVDLHERMLVRGAQAPIRSDLTLSLATGPEEALPVPAPDWAAKLASAVSVPADRALGVAARVDDLDSARIGSLTFEQILAGLEQSAKAKSTRKAARDADAKDANADVSAAEQAELKAELDEDSRLFIALAALFRRDPSAIERAVTAIHAKSPAATSLMDALGSAGSEQAQRALATLTATKALGEELESHAAVSLSRTPKPSPASILAFKALLRKNPFDLAGLYGLGTFARRLRDEGRVAESDALGEFLLARLKQAQNSTDLVTVLRSIANSGYARALPRVTLYLSDDRDKVRSAAVRALQSMQDPQIDGILATRLRDDPSSVVRLAALDAAQVRVPSTTLTDAVASASAEAADTHVRFRAVELMIRWLPERPALRATLASVAKNDAEPKVRSRAQAAL